MINLPCFAEDVDVHGHNNVKNVDMVQHKGEMGF